MRKLILLVTMTFLLAAGAIGTIAAMTADPEQATACELNAC